MIHPTVNPRVTTSLDWEAYFREFCVAHGRWFVVHKGVLLFEDGWTHSQSEYAGPEWPPPEDEKELLELFVAYWQRRTEIVLPERNQVKALLENLKMHQLLRPTAALQQKTIYYDPDSQKLRQDRGVIDWQGLEGRLSWLEEDLALCRAKLLDYSSKLETLLCKGTPLALTQAS